MDLHRTDLQKYTHFVLYEYAARTLLKLGTFHIPAIEWKINFFFKNPSPEA